MGGSSSSDWLRNTKENISGSENEDKLSSRSSVLVWRMWESLLPLVACINEILSCRYEWCVALEYCGVAIGWTGSNVAVRVNLRQWFERVLPHIYCNMWIDQIVTPPNCSDQCWFRKCVSVEAQAIGNGVELTIPPHYAPVSTGWLGVYICIYITTLQVIYADYYMIKSEQCNFTI